MFDSCEKLTSIDVSSFNTENVNDISAIFKNNETAVELTGLLSSLTMDFFMKTAASQNMTSGRFSTLPLGISNKYKISLNILTNLYNIFFFILTK